LHGFGGGFRLDVLDRFFDGLFVVELFGHIVLLEDKCSSGVYEYAVLKP
jgi:hypothetical protein